MSATPGENGPAPSCDSSAAGDAQASSPAVPPRQDSLAAQVDAVRRGELRFGGRPGPARQWKEIPRAKRRLVLMCRHGLRHESAPRKDIGGLTGDRAYSLAVELLLDDEAATLRARCPSCGTVWSVPLKELIRLARSRGHRLLQQLVDEVPDVRVDTASGSG